MLNDERCRVVAEPPHLFKTFRGAQAEIDAAMDATVAEMSVKGGVRNSRR